MASGDKTANPVVNNVDKEKKLRTSQGSKPPPFHPTYLQMITEAITSLKERTGSSHYAIAAYVGNKYQSQLPPNFKKLLTVQLRNLAKSGKLTKVKNSFKLSEELKKRLKPKAARPVKAKSLANKPAAKSKVAPGPKKVSKPAKTAAIVAKVLNVFKPKPATSTEKVEKTAAPVKKGETVTKGTRGKKKPPISLVVAGCVS